MTLPGETGVEFVDPSVPPGNRNNLIAWIAGRSDGDKCGCAGRVLSQEQARRWTAGRSTHRSEPAALRSVSPEPTGFARRARQPARDSVGRGAAVRRADLLAGGAPVPELRLVVLAAGSPGVRRRSSRDGWPVRTVSTDRAGPAATQARARKRPRVPAARQPKSGVDAHSRCRTRPRQYPAPDGGGQARRGRPTAPSLKQAGSVATRSAKVIT